MRAELHAMVFAMVVLTPKPTLAQTIGPETAGLGLDGSTGLFLNPTSTTLGVGHIRVGVFNGPSTGTGEEALPLAFALGFSRRIELMGSTMHWSLTEREEISSAGAKISLLSGAGLQLAADMRLQEITRYPLPGDTLSGSRMVGRLVADYPLGSIAATLNLGVARAEFGDTRYSGDYFTGGLGLVLPVKGNFQVLAEFQVDQRTSSQNMTRGALGFKWFIKEHLQIGAGVLADYRHDRPSSGLFFNLGFSSERMSVFKWQVSLARRIILPSLEQLALEDLLARNSSPVAEPAQIPDGQITRQLTAEEESLPLPPPLENVDNVGSTSDIPRPQYLPEPPTWIDNER